MSSSTSPSPVLQNSYSSFSEYASFDLEPHQLEDLFEDHGNFEALTKLGGVQGLAKSLKVDLKTGLLVHLAPEKVSKKKKAEKVNLLESQVIASGEQDNETLLRINR